MDIQKPVSFWEILNMLLGVSVKQMLYTFNFILLPSAMEQLLIENDLY